MGMEGMFEKEIETTGHYKEMHHKKEKLNEKKRVIQFSALGHQKHELVSTYAS